MNKPDLNPVNGILLVNKPQGLSSNAVLQKLKRLYRAKKAGHTGSLDPLATGMLPICFGEATKVCSYILEADKAYEATGKLGIKTSTADSTGEIIEQCDEFSINEEQLRAVIGEFIGNSKQVPSMFSALKHKGTPLYKLARAGKTIERPARDITIHAALLTAFNGKEFSVQVSCSKGTYIRNLIEDIGEQLEVGAHVTKLHRSYTAGFSDEPMHDLAELEAKTEKELLNYLLPIERAVEHLPLVSLLTKEVLDLRQGKVVDFFHSEDEKKLFRLRDEDGRFIGLGEIDSHGKLAVKRLLTEEAVASP